MIILVGVVLLVAGVIGLLVSVSVPDGNGGSIGCGNAVVSDVSAARAEDNKNPGNSPIVQQIPIANQIVPQTHYVADCNSALASRRWWSIPLTIVGILPQVAQFVLGFALAEFRGDRHAFLVN